MESTKWEVVRMESSDDDEGVNRNGFLGGRNEDQPHGVEGSKQKMEDELETLRKERDLLLKELESVKSEKEKLENNPDNHQVVLKKSKINFELNFSNDEAKAEALKIAVGFPGITSITMDVKDKRLSLRGSDIDPLPLWDELNKVCKAKLVNFYITEMKKEQTKEEKKVGDHRMAPHPFPGGPPYQMPPGFNHGAASPMAHFSLIRGGMIYLAFLVLLVIVRLAP